MSSTEQDNSTDTGYLVSEAIWRLIRAGDLTCQVLVTFWNSEKGGYDDPARVAALHDIVAEQVKTLQALKEVQRQLLQTS